MTDATSAIKSDRRNNLLRMSIAALIIVIGPASLAVAPLPLRAIVPFAALGFTGGILFSVRDQALSFVTMFVMYVGLNYLDDRATATLPPAVMYSWQPAAIAFSALTIAYVIARRVKGLPLTSD